MISKSHERTRRWRAVPENAAKERIRNRKRMALVYATPEGKQKMGDSHERYVSTDAGAKAARRAKLKYRLRRYKLTVDGYEAMLAGQNNGCAICGHQHTDDKPLHVDHCHDTRAVRGLLCLHCNTALGAMAEDPQRLLRAIDYLNSRGATT